MFNNLPAKNKEKKDDSGRCLGLPHTCLGPALLLNVTATFNYNMRNLKFEAQAVIVFFATVNQTFGGSSQLPTSAEHCFIV